MDVAPEIQDRLKRVSDEFLKEMGRATLHWSLVEHYVNWTIGALLVVPLGQVIALIVPIRNFRQRLEIMTEVFKEAIRDADAVKDLIKIVGEIERLYAVRNKVAHYLWTVPDDVSTDTIRATIVKLKRNAELQFERSPITLDELRAASSEMFKVSERLGHLMKRFRPAPSR